MALTIRKLHGSLGAEIQGVNLASPLDQDTKSKIEAAWKIYGVLVFREQDISDAEHVAFSRHFGELEILPEADRTDIVIPEIFVLSLSLIHI